MLPSLHTLGGEPLEVLLVDRRPVVIHMSLAEIGEALGIPVGTVKSRLHNALAVLREDERTARYFED